MKRLHILNQKTGTTRTGENEMTNTPGFNTRISVAFAADKNGKPVAYRWSRAALRWIKMSYAEAKVFVSSGSADEVEYRR
jgi:hypothetical protein